MNKDSQKELAALRKKGFKVETNQGGTTLISPTGARWRPGNDFKSIRKWAEDQLTSARRDRGERRDGGGTQDAHRRSTRFTARADGVLSHWDRLGSDWQLSIVREMLYRLGSQGQDKAYDALKVLDE